MSCQDVGLLKRWGSRKETQGDYSALREIMLIWFMTRAESKLPLAWPSVPVINPFLYIWSSSLLVLNKPELCLSLKLSRTLCNLELSYQKSFLTKYYWTSYFTKQNLQSRTSVAPKMIPHICQCYNIHAVHCDICFLHWDCCLLKHQEQYALVFLCRSSEDLVHWNPLKIVFFWKAVDGSFWLWPCAQ